MQFEIDGIWTGLAWGCAYSGRPALQLVLRDAGKRNEQSAGALSLPFSTLVHLIQRPLNRLNLIQIHATKLDTSGRIIHVGDPLSQVSVYPLVTHLLESLEMRVTMMANNRTDISLLDPRVNTVLVPVMPSAGQENANYWANLNYLSDDGEILFVVQTEEDYDWMKIVIDELGIASRFTVHMTTGKTRIPQTSWAKKLIRDAVPVHFLPPIPFTAIPLRIDKPEQQSRL